MKRFTQVCLILALICTILGLGFFLGGIALGGSANDLLEAIDRGEFRLGTDFSRTVEPEDAAVDPAGAKKLPVQVKGTGSGETFDCGVGSMEVYIDGSEADYDYELDCAAGDLKVGQKSYGGFRQQEIKNGGADGKKIEASCDMGALSIHFNGDGSHHSEDHAHE